MPHYLEALKIEFVHLQFKPNKRKHKSQLMAGFVPKPKQSSCKKKGAASMKTSVKSCEIKSGSQEMAMSRLIAKFLNNNNSSNFCAEY